MRRLFAVARDLTGNLPPLPDQIADRLCREANSSDALRDRRSSAAGAPVMNIPQHQEPALRAWLARSIAALVPLNSFCEWADTKPKRIDVVHASKTMDFMQSFACAPYGTHPMRVLIVLCLVVLSLAAGMTSASAPSFAAACHREPC